MTAAVRSHFPFKPAYSWRAYNVYAVLVADLLVKSCVSNTQSHSLLQSPNLSFFFFCTFSGIGFSVGVIASVILFRRACQPASPPSIQRLKFISGRAWPIALSTGFGAGAAYADCDRSFNPARIAGVRVVQHPPTEPK